MNSEDMRLHVLGSSSAGNCYILQNEDEALVIEAGIDIREVKKALGFNLPKVSGAVISHRHGDHARYVGAFVRNGIPTLALEDVFSSRHIFANPFAVAVRPGKGYRAGGFRLTAFPVAHDVPCVGWLIRHDEMGKLLFVTDTVMLNYTFDGLTVVMVEANYADDIIDGRLMRGEITPAMRSRIIQSHMSLETAKRILSRNDLSGVDHIILIHLSDGNSDERRFVREVRELTGKIVVAADRGEVIDISKEPF